MLVLNIPLSLGEISGDNLTDCPCKGVLFDKEYQAILAVQVVKAALTFQAT
jgi:hypothetical protein